ncbi:GntR family transcriptional regulator [Corynebacterium lubricantis]|uniref:GntR family transcriptional regulator n=1 Tax=Corynebacterium lubricantis TaxID=541095 RepID=UPI000375DBD9|nr:GntR family transcriptional regulator [Corynebacterium lubricantis]
MDNEAEPLFRQIATLISDAIVDGEYGPGDRVASTNDLAHFHEINPATARKGIALLRDEGILENRRGVGTFVAENAKERILENRRRGFPGDYLAPLIDEAVRLNFARDELHELVDRVAESRGMYK